MADFALWATACESALWKAGTFWSAYCGNRDEAVESVIEADPIATAVRAMLVKRTEWTGTATELLDALEKLVNEGETKAKSWPKSARGLSGQLRRMATFLRKTGIEIRFERKPRAARTRIITITNITRASEIEGAHPSISSELSMFAEKPNLTNDIVPFNSGTVDRNADDKEQENNSTVHTNLLKNSAGNGVDDVDANLPSQSGPEKTSVPWWSIRL
jgi:hypothetical protein